MKRFARLVAELDETTRADEKVSALVRYFAEAEPADAAWAVWLLGGARPRRLVPVRRLAEWAMAESGTPAWLFDESYRAVGDLAETIALLLPAAPDPPDVPLCVWIEERLLPLEGEPEDVQRRAVARAWREMDAPERFLWNKLITGGFRAGVARSLLVHALARVGGLDEAVLAHRLAGAWEPRPELFQRLLSPEAADARVSRAYPFFLAESLEGDPAELGEPGEWQAEWLWDGIRAQLVRRGGRTTLWSRAGESVTERFPELEETAALLPDGTVLDGEIVAWRDGAPLPLAHLRRRLGRARLTPKVMADVPVVFMAHDVLELDGADVRERPLAWRRMRLEALLEATPAAARLLVSPTVAAEGWDAVRAAHGRAREVGAGGLVLKRLDAPYGVGRERGAWWKWKARPFTVDAVLVYAQPGRGRRAALHADYTFAVRDGDELVPFARADAGLSDEEVARLDAWIRHHTVEKFGPVRAVHPEQVFELAFEGIEPSPRHKSGVAVRSPRILRWRADKAAADADTLAALRELMERG
ncbi:MAG TPA: ATP-dependent DNA ligase [Longimicrobiales bacterium]|nr:ATP-dependent DNA ligase [Longimicrobiales bacterium]